MSTKTILKRSRNKADSPFKKLDMQQSPVKTLKLKDLQQSPAKNNDLTVQHVQLAANSPVKETHVTHHVVDSQVEHVELTATPPQNSAVVKLTFNAPAEELTDEDKEQVPGS